MTPAPIPLTGSDLDRAAHHRTDPAWLAGAFASDRVRVIAFRAGAPLLTGSAGQAGPRDVLWLGPQAGALAPAGPRVFLGLTPRGSPVFAIDLPEGFQLSASPLAGLGAFEEFRPAAGAMDPRDAGLAACARSLFDWHRRHGFCANCGAPTEAVDAGWKRRCPACAAEHFPRTDPVAIMLAVHGDACLLGRQKAWPPGFHSCLAGFVEPGETVEQAAARELFEEAGVRADPASARYLFGQPWPFPSSLMMGLILDAEGRDLVIDATELESARWFTREEAKALVEARHPDAYAPPPLAIAHHILKAWVEGG